MGQRLIGLIRGIGFGVGELVIFATHHLADCRGDGEVVVRGVAFVGREHAHGWVVGHFEPRGALIDFVKHREVDHVQAILLNQLGLGPGKLAALTWDGVELCFAVAEVGPAEAGVNDRIVIFIVFFAVGDVAGEIAA